MKVSGALNSSCGTLIRKRVMLGQGCLRALGQQRLAAWPGPVKQTDKPPRRAGVDVSGTSPRATPVSVTKPIWWVGKP